MSTPNEERRKQLEGRALIIAMGGNLFMGAAGILAGILSNSNAIMMDGLYSLVGFGSAFLGRRISLKIDAGPDKRRPFGYAADEAIFSTFRSLSLLGLVLFAISNAIKNIYSYYNGMMPEPLIFGPMFIYFAAIGLTCVLIWAFHYFTWRQTGKTSAILRLESKAALFDGLFTAAAAIGLGAIYLFRDGALSAIAPVGDSIIVLFLCILAIGSYLRDFRGGLGELANATASPELLAAARRALRPAIAEDGGALRDMSVTKQGRTILITVYYNPLRAITAEEVDILNLRMVRDARRVIDGADVYLMISQYARRWPDEVNPYRDEA
ncbi:cation transporter [Ruegeria atlantica]|uniref:Cation diffusion facilitator family transporter n=1 Tax=Ruegeria atlantica TaxID=81569 RepID=A0A0P1E372_9RHOB|nr:cation transporter [Ruegeria atlantica]CUH41802.1 cation diffusion facilitator family transporter [Ruegeria atlantica]